jgi:hypothetical protein
MLSCRQGYQSKIGKKDEKHNGGKEKFEKRNLKTEI